MPLLLVAFPIEGALRMANAKRLLPVELCSGWSENPSDNPSTEAVRQFAQNVRGAIGDNSVRSVAAECGLSHVTVLNALNGKSWPDAWTITHLERGLNTEPWPHAAIRAEMT